MYPYKTGDVVRVYHYPYVSKTEKERLEKEGAENKHPLFGEGKQRYGIIVGSGGKAIATIPVVQIMTHEGKTEIKGYKLRDDEVRIPNQMNYVKKNGEKKVLKGVIKMERFELFGADEITAPLTNVPLRTKIDMVERYEAIIDDEKYLNTLNRDSPKHVNIMKDFKDSVIAEKLQFLESEEGTNKFDAMKYSRLAVTELQKIGYHGDLNIYSVILQGKIDTFTYNIASKKNEKQIIKDWGNPKPAVYWLKQDAKYHALVKNIDQLIIPDPIAHHDKYVLFERFKKLKTNKKQQNEYER